MNIVWSGLKLMSQTQSSTGPGVRQWLLISPAITAVQKAVLYPVTCSATCWHTAGDVPSAPGAKPASILLDRPLQRGSKILPSAVKNRQRHFGGVCGKGSLLSPGMGGMSAVGGSAHGAPHSHHWALFRANRDPAYGCKAWFVAFTPTTFLGVDNLSNFGTFSLQAVVFFRVFSSFYRKLACKQTNPRFGQSSCVMLSSPQKCTNLQAWGHMLGWYNTVQLHHDIAWVDAEKSIGIPWGNVELGGGESLLYPLFHFAGKSTAQQWE